MTRQNREMLCEVLGALAVLKHTVQDEVKDTVKRMSEFVKIILDSEEERP